MIIGEGTSATQGTAVTYARREGRNRVDTTHFSSDSITQLSARLTPPPRPTFPWRTHFLAWTFGLAAAIGVWSAVSSGGGVGAFMAGFLSLFVTWIPGGIIALLTERSQRRTWLVRQEGWDRNDERLRAAYYCARDDVVVEHGTAYRPEQFVASLFSAPVPAR
ncbi:hypothetical protein V6S02_09480 [Microbacterium sp. CCNWLW134]|uniref:hypothetical protein n=1 Tax=Microbacterium sp. CCNWLW134 TaxID=3122064 RepID=UPI00300FED6E